MRPAWASRCGGSAAPPPARRRSAALPGSARREARLGRGCGRGRSALAAGLAIGGLAGLVPLESLMEQLSDYADSALERALATAMLERTPNEAPRGFAVIALGKHGSRELNYSSDIDPIFLFDPVTLPRRPREEPGQAAGRAGRRGA